VLILEASFCDDLKSFSRSLNAAQNLNITPLHEGHKEPQKKSFLILNEREEKKRKNDAIKKKYTGLKSRGKKVYRS
jgi:hypothetical protein